MFYINSKVQFLVIQYYGCFKPITQKAKNMGVRGIVYHTNQFLIFTASGAMKTPQISYMFLSSKSHGAQLNSSPHQ